MSASVLAHMCSRHGWHVESSTSVYYCAGTIRVPDPFGAQRVPWILPSSALIPLDALELEEVPLLLALGTSFGVLEEASASLVALVSKDVASRPSSLYSYVNTVIVPYLASRLELGI